MTGLKEEAIAVYNKINSDRTSLVDDKRNDNSIAQPFFWHHIRPERRRQAVIDTWQQAKPGTVQRSLFDRGATTGEFGPNWVTQWLLYSVFRSRDIRNNRNRRGGEGSGGGNVCSFATLHTETLTSTTAQVRAPAEGARMQPCLILPETSMFLVEEKRQMFILSLPGSREPQVGTFVLMMELF